MSQPMADAARSAASVLFNLPEYEVIEVAHDEADGRRVVITTPALQAACPGCGFVDLGNGEVLDVVDGRDSAAVSAWLAGRPRWWRRRVRKHQVASAELSRSQCRFLERLSWKGAVATDGVMALGETPVTPRRDLGVAACSYRHAHGVTFDRLSDSAATRGDLQVSGAAGCCRSTVRNRCVTGWLVGGLFHGSHPVPLPAAAERRTTSIATDV